MKNALGPGQYRNAVASGHSRALDIVKVAGDKPDPTLPRYGTDLAQRRFLNSNHE
ncbi:MAG TPA: hypothetical protein VF074_21110 [Pyrinomonadaceae bacterium]